MNNRSHLPTITRRPQKFYQSLPKVELHRHLEGSLRLGTMVEVARAHGLDILGTGQLRTLVQVHEDDPYTFQNFLSKFQTLRLFYRSPEIIGRITREAIADAALDNVRYMELRFTPVALSVAQGFSLDEVMDWVIDAAKQASQEYGVKVRLIANMNRHESVEQAEKVVERAVERKDRGIVALDLGGKEPGFSALPFAPLFLQAQKAGLHVTIHAGEWGGAENVAEAINGIGAERIGHGVRIMEDPALVPLARERGTAFEVCVTSNYQSGVVSGLALHPIRDMLEKGLKVTINTDDPSVSQITLGYEYRLLTEELAISLDTLKKCVLTAANAAFLPLEERQQLVERIKAEFAQKT